MPRYRPLFSFSLVCGRLSYPAVVFHVDLTELDMDELRDAYHPSHVVFQRVLMEEGALPAYAHGEALLPWLKAKVSYII